MINNTFLFNNIPWGMGALNDVVMEWLEYVVHFGKIKRSDVSVPAAVNGMHHV